MKARLIKWLIVLSWLVMSAWLIRYEAFPHRFANVLSGYRSLLSDGPLLLDNWMKITFQDAHIGYSHTRMDIDEHDPNERYILRNQTVLDMKIMGEMQGVAASAEAVLDVLYRLQTFKFSMTADRYTMRIEGKRAGEETFIIHVISPAGRESSRMKIPDDVVLHSPLMEMTMEDLKPGREIRMRTLDPATLSIADVAMRSLRRETVDVDGEEVKTTVLATEYQGMEVLTWVDAQGHVVRQETPFGWIMEACNAREAVAFRTESEKQADMMRALAVPVDRPLDAPRELKQLRVRLVGLQLPAKELHTARQEAMQGTNAVVLEVGYLPLPGEASASKTNVAARYLEPSPFIQSAHPDIVKRAESIVEGLDNAAAKALAIHQWVYRKVIKDNESSLPSALDVLRNMRGDCNEHTYLFTALARAAGIPTRVNIGLVYLEDAFYYHAWPSVYLGEWYELDPTFGQETVDASHIYLLEGEFATQLKLLGVIGQVDAVIEEQRY